MPPKVSTTSHEDLGTKPSIHWLIGDLHLNHSTQPSGGVEGRPRVCSSGWREIPKERAGGSWCLTWGLITDSVFYAQRHRKNGYKQGEDTIIIVFQKELSQKITKNLNPYQ
jgi:hypothetical protein